MLGRRLLEVEEQLRHNLSKTLVVKAHRRLYHSTLGLGVIKTKRRPDQNAHAEVASENRRKRPPTGFGLQFWGYYPLPRQALEGGFVKTPMASGA